MIIYVLMFFTLGLVFVSVMGFIWAARANQFEDLVTPAYRILLDEKGEEINERKQPR